MTVGFIAVIIQFAIGILVGGISGYYGGTVDILLMRLAEVVGSLPFIPLALILSALIGNKVSDVGRIIMIMLILGFPSYRTERNDDHYRTGNNLICNLYADRIRIIILRIRCCRANSFMGKYAEQLSFFRSYLTVLVEMGIPVSCIRTLYCKYQLVW